MRGLLCYVDLKGMSWVISSDVRRRLCMEHCKGRQLSREGRPCTSKVPGRNARDNAQVRRALLQWAADG